jgi:putative MATE family efflux protein
VRNVPRTPRVPALDREILRLAVPALGALVAEPLFLLSDSAVVGTLGVQPLAALGVAATVLATLVGLCVFLAYATTAAVARRTGAGDPAGALRQGLDGVWLAVGLGLVLLVALEVSAPELVRWLGASAPVQPLAVTYLRISAFGLPSMLVVLAATGVLRGRQDTRTPLVVAITAAAVNLALCLLFVLGLGFGVAGSAWATVTAQTGAALVYGVLLVRAARSLGARLSPDRAGVRRSASAGAPLFVRTVALRAVFVTATAVAARIGDAELAAYQVSMQTWYLLALAMDALAIAGQAIVGRQLGAGDAAAARATTRRLVGWGVGAGVALGVLLLAVRPAFVLLFTDDPSVRALLSAALVLVALHQLVAGPVFVLDGVLIGAGDGRFLAWAQLVTYLAFLPAAVLVLALDGGLVALWVALAEFMLVRLVVLAWRARGDRWLVTGAVR